MEKIIEVDIEGNAKVKIIKQAIPTTPPIEKANVTILQHEIDSTAEFGTYETSVLEQLTGCAIYGIITLFFGYIFYKYYSTHGMFCPISLKHLDNTFSITIWGILTLTTGSIFFISFLMFCYTNCKKILNVISDKLNRWRKTIF
jgi:hypothetical protein